VRETIKDLADAGEKNIVLNLKDVSYIDSAGLGVLVGAYASVSNQGCQVKLANLQSKVDSLMQITKLYTVFPAFNNESEAVASFGAKAATR